MTSTRKRSSQSNEICVGFVHRGYNEQRNFSGMVAEGVEFVRRRDLLRFPEHLYYRATNRTPLLMHNLHTISFGVDLMHFFNGISIGNTPWMTTFETSLPRWGERTVIDGLGVRLLAGKHCRKVIAISENAANIQRMKMRQFGRLGEQVVEKISVIHPPQPVLSDAPARQPAEGGALRFCLVGADFFRKGGREVLDVFDGLLSEGAAVHLTIVSTLQCDDYATHTTKSDSDMARAMIAKWPGKITHFDKLPNLDVLNLLRQCHVGLLPSWADTYGYSVLEAQAAGCPVVTTDIRALPEINCQSAGWVVQVPKNASGNALIGSRDERADFQVALSIGLRNVLREIIADPLAVTRKGEAALERIRKFHDPVKHAKRLISIYNKALE